MNFFIKALHREFLLYHRQPKLLINSALFFLSVVAFFPLMIPSDLVLLKQITPGLIWIALLLALLMSSEHLFQHDADEGIIEQWLSTRKILTLLISAKIIVYWLFIIISFLLLTPLLALLYNFSCSELAVLAISIFLGSPALLALCALTATFSIGLEQKGMLMGIVLLPLTLPILIFGSGTLLVFMQGHSPLPYFAILASISLLMLTFIPLAMSMIIRIRV